MRKMINTIYSITFEEEDKGYVRIIVRGGDGFTIGTELINGYNSYPDAVFGEIGTHYINDKVEYEVADSYEEYILEDNDGND